MTVLPGCSVRQRLGGCGDDTDGGRVHRVHDGDGHHLDNLGLADIEGDWGGAHYLHHLLARSGLYTGLDAGLQQ